MQATRQIVAMHPQISIIVFSNCGKAEIINEITSAGAGAYVMKTSPGEEVLNAIHAVYHNRNYYCSNTMQVLKTAAARPRDNGKVHTKICLTIREHEVLLLMCAEKSNKEIGVLLELSTALLKATAKKYFVKHNP